MLYPSNVRLYLVQSIMPFLLILELREKITDFSSLLAGAVPVAENGLRGVAWFRVESHGELGFDHVPRIGPSRRPERSVRLRRANDETRGGTRAGPPVVRQPGHHEVVERPVA